MRELELHSQDNLSLASTETPPPLYLPPHHPSNHYRGMQRVGRAGTPQRAGGESFISNSPSTAAAHPIPLCSTVRTQFHDITFTFRIQVLNSRFGTLVTCMFPCLHVIPVSGHAC